MMSLFGDKNQEEHPGLPGFAVRPKKGANATLVVLSLAIVAISGVAGYFWYQNSQLAEGQTGTENEEIQDIIANISEFFVLPTDEEPTVATVSDPELLKGQAFFAKAKKGDKVIIYAKAKKAILYDPVARKIVDVAPINIGQPEAGQ
jgi:hypothetical protein